MAIIETDAFTLRRELENRLRRIHSVQMRELGGIIEDRERLINLLEKSFRSDVVKYVVREIKAFRHWKRPFTVKEIGERRGLDLSTEDCINFDLLATKETEIQIITGKFLE